MAAGIEQKILLENSGFTVEVAVTETYEVLSNASSVTVGLRVKSSYLKGIQYLSGTLKLDGKLLVDMDSTISTHHVAIDAYGTWYNVVRSSNAYTDSPWTMADIAHNTDGSRSVKLELEMRGYGENNYLSFRVAATKEIPLTHIPRASTAGASDANIGAISTVSVIRRSAAYYHSIAYRFGALSGYLNADGSVSAQETKMSQTSIPFLVPENFYAQIPDSPTGICVLTVRTYSGAHRIGEDQTTQFTVTAARNLCTPQVSGVVEDVNTRTIALTGDRNTLVRYVSNALCTITAAARNSASIASKAIAGVKVSGNSLQINAVDTNSVVFACADTRGYTTSATVKKTLVPYIHLSAGVAAGRKDPTSGRAWLTVSGNWFHGSFGAVNNTLAISYAINGGASVSMNVATDGNTYTAEAELTGLDYQKSHTITVTVTDQLETVAKSVPVGKGIPVFDWGEENFAFHVPVELASGCDILKNGAIAYASSGYGLGSSSIHSLKAVYNEEQAKAISETGWYCYNGTSLATGCAGVGLILAEITTDLYKVLHFRDLQGFELVNTFVFDKWTGWEWENPVMVPGIEYRTRERYDVTPVYTLLADLGTTATDYSATINIPGITRLIRAVPILDNRLCTDWDIDAFVHTNNQFYFCPEKVAETVAFYMHCGSYRTGKNLKAQIWYTK